MTITMPDEEIYFTVPELARLLKFSKAKVYEYCRLGLWPHGRQSENPLAPIRFSRADVAVIDGLLHQNAAAVSGQPLRAATPPSRPELARALERLRS
jgi:hypothetical protein